MAAVRRTPQRTIKRLLPLRVKRAGRISVSAVPCATKFALLRAEMSHSTTHCRLGDTRLRVDSGLTKIDYYTLYGALIDRHFDTDVERMAVLDVGAHKGYFAARCLSEGAALVHSYEPATSNYRALEASARGANEWATFRSAVGDHHGTVRLHLSDHSWAHSVVSPEVHGEQMSEVVDLIPLRSALGEITAAGRPVHVKINVEGAAGTMLRSTTSSDWHAVSSMWLDYEPQDPVPWKSTRQHLLSCGFDIATSDGQRWFLDRNAR